MSLSHHHTWDGMIIERNEWKFQDGTRIPYVKIADGESTVTLAVPQGVSVPDEFLLVRGQVTAEFYTNQREQIKARYQGFAPYSEKK